MWAIIWEGKIGLWKIVLLADMKELLEKLLLPTIRQVYFMLKKVLEVKEIVDINRYTSTNIQITTHILKKLYLKVIYNL